MSDTAIAQAFKAVYEQDAWSFGSGPGSRSANTVEYRAFLERFIAENAVETVTDLGCGDWQSTQQIDWSSTVYTGFDVVEEVVERNKKRFAKPNVVFSLFRDIDDLPAGDLLIAKEVLQHLPTRVVLDYLPVILERYRYALITNTTGPGGTPNVDIEPGGFRPLLLDRPPFSVPGAKVLTYCVRQGDAMWLNTVYLVIGQDPFR